jgi:hypothetical protein
MNYRYTKKDIKIIDMSNQNDWMYNWIREKSGKGVQTNSSGSSDNNPYNTHSHSFNTHSKEIEYCTKHHIRLNQDGLCSVCMESNNK